LRSVLIEASPGAAAAARIILMPGAYHEPEQFEREGFSEAVRRRGLKVDLQFVAPELQHLLDRSVLDRLGAEIIAPARAAGCMNLWLGGVSLGGFIALAYAERRRTDLDGLCLLAPYLGNRMVTGEIAAAGGVRSWRPASIADDDEERRIWAFIRDLPQGGPALVLGIGRQDRFGHGHGLLAAALPPEAVDVVDGGHDWAAWIRLWDMFLDRFKEHWHG
jgi:pimeloyl-ACP methyl ester carboxylesterase